MSAPKDLAYRIIAFQHPHGRPTTSYCWPTQEQNDAAIERDRQHDAAKIRPLIEAEYAALLSQVARLREGLKDAVSAIENVNRHIGLLGGEQAKYQNARTILSETETH